MITSRKENESARVIERAGAPLVERLRQRIRTEGAISFRVWMEAALYDEREGYYCRSDLARWGRAGDYRTSAERSKLFAATFARYFATLYRELGSPHAWSIIEAGAGAGHFACGILETLQRFYPRVFSATRYLLDEASANSRERSTKYLAQFSQQISCIHLDESLPTVEIGVIFANELLDALPVHRVVKRNGELRELCVDVADTGEFVWTEQALTAARLATYVEQAGISLAEGQIAEVNLAAEQWIARAAAILKRGFVVMVDYGAEADELYGAPHRRAGTLRAFKRHQLTNDPLACPGKQDLTTTVDWTQIKKACRESGLQTVIFERQDQFLLRAGALEQLQRLTAQAQSGSEALILSTSARELILPGGMSESFQVLVQQKS